MSQDATIERILIRLKNRPLIKNIKVYKNNKKYPIGFTYKGTRYKISRNIGSIYSDEFYSIKYYSNKNIASTPESRELLQDLNIHNIKDIKSNISELQKKATKLPTKKYRLKEDTKEDLKKIEETIKKRLPEAIITDKSFDGYAKVTFLFRGMALKANFSSASQAKIIVYPLSSTTTTYRPTLKAIQKAEERLNTMTREEAKEAGKELSQKSKKIPQKKYKLKEFIELIQ